MALDAAYVAKNPVAMAEFTLSHAYRLVRQKTENPLDALFDPLLAPDVALQRAWHLAEQHEAEHCIYWLLVLNWKLQQISRMVRRSRNNPTAQHKTRLQSWRTQAARSFPPVSNNPNGGH